MTDRVDKEEALTLFSSKQIENAEELFQQICANDKALNRLERVIDGDVIMQKTTFVREFSSFCGKHKEWSSACRILESLSNNRKTVGCKRAREELTGDYPREKHARSEQAAADEIGASSQTVSDEHGVRVFWEQFSDWKFESDVNTCLILRRQISGNCYLHAPMVLEHYLVSIATNGENCGMINIGMYERSLLNGDALREFILCPRGGSAQHVLDSLCNLNGYDSEWLNFNGRQFQATCDFIYENVKQKPFLVTGFRVYPHFLGTSQSSFSQSDIDKSKSAHEVSSNSHSMLLIGARKDKQGAIYFLLQNWWKGRFFIEVSADYMRFCRASVEYVTKVITRASSVPTYIAPYAETCLDGGGDEILDERELCSL